MGLIEVSDIKLNYVRIFTPIPSEIEDRIKNTDWLRLFRRLGCLHKESWSVKHVSKFSALDLAGFDYCVECHACRRRIGV